MSLFKAREWWSTASAGREGIDSDSAVEGSWSERCLVADRLGPHTDADCLVLGDATALRIYKPDGAFKPEHLLIEMQFEDHILQVDTGKFLAGSGDVQLIVLHPMKYSVYLLQRKEGHTDVGDQNMLVSIISHTLARKAYSLVHGNFGNVKSRELVCVHALDGTLTFFDQELALFSCPFSNTVIPGPFGYIKSCDSFVIHKGNWILEIYSYQQMVEFGNRGQRTHKKQAPQWVYNPGEEIFSLQVIQTSNNFSSIVMLGERHLYCLQDNGLMKFMKKFDFMPVCFCAYLIGWYYEPNCRLLIMVASEDSKLLIYEHTTLLWSCELMFTPIAIMPSFLKGLPGGVVTLSEDGIINCCYLGTEPDLSGSVPSLQSCEHVDSEAVQNELTEVEATLKKLTENEDIEDDDIPLDEIISVTVVVKDCVQHLHDDNSANTLHLLMCPVVVRLLFKLPRTIQNVHVSYSSCPPFATSEAVQCLNRVNAVETLETQVYVSSEVAISELYVKVLVTFTDDFGKIRTVSDTALVPMSLCYVCSTPLSEYKHTFSIHSNLPEVDLIDLFSEYPKDEFSKHEATSNSVTFVERATNSAVSISSQVHRYSVQSDHYSHMTAVVEYLILKLGIYHQKEGNTEFVASLNVKFNLELLQSFMKCIEGHASARLQLQCQEEELTILQSQFTLIQKKLLTQYGSLPPGDCDSLEFLLKDTYRRMADTVQLIGHFRENVYRAGSALIAVGRLAVKSFELMKADKSKTGLLKEALSLFCLYEDNQDWEEIVSKSVSHVLSTRFGKSEKDKEKLAPVTEQGILNPANLKRCLKQIKTLFERIFSDLKEQQRAAGEDTENKTALHSRSERVEELVEML